MSTFHPFPLLPFELRARIWEMTVEPRTVEIRFTRDRITWGNVLYVTSSTPVPGVMQTCHEARNLGLYQRAFSSGDEPRYVWVNFEADMISIGNSDYCIIKPEQLLIRRLRFEDESTDGHAGFFHFHSKELRDFCNLTEIHVICQDGLLDWQDAWECVYWPCPDENVRFIDKKSGQMVDGYALDKMLEEWLESMTNE
ncbi:hypothetical protein G7046_g6169 [Stylonectria norvegica]|nr:hypothetical protein G7046_g6169 [Stylonectria norvegica]